MGMGGGLERHGPTPASRRPAKSPPLNRVNMKGAHRSPKKRPRGLNVLQGARSAAFHWEQIADVRPAQGNDLHHTFS